MSSNVAAGLVLAVVATVAVGEACAPGPIAPRRSAAADGGRTAGGGEVTIARDAATPADGSANRGAGGSAGRAGAAGSAPEMAKLSPSDAASAPTGDARGAVLDASARDAPPARAPRAGDLVIDEALVNPAGDDLGREWIEIENLSDDWLDLSELHLANASSDVAVGAGSTAPGSLRLLEQSADPTKNGGAPVGLAYGTKIIMNNADGQIAICLGVCASGLVLDSLSWGTLSADFTGHALVVDPQSRRICADSTPFGTAGSFGTPGEPNPACAENADAGSHPDVSVAD
jgi:hypothetical protein